MMLFFGGVAQAQAQVVIDGDVYGGGNLADVGTNPGDSTKVYILGGNVRGNVYGGGRGRAAADAVTNPETGAVITPAVEPKDPAVYGGVHVYIGDSTSEGITGSATFGVAGEDHAIIGGNIFGGNNILGTPKDNVKIDIWHTAHNLTNPVGVFGSLSDFNTDVTHDADAFAIQGVYGGGNEAHYIPLSTESTTYTSTVNIHKCDNTVKLVYGGGRAAHVGSDYVTSGVSVNVFGGRIDTLFGGGDGHTLATGHTAGDYTIVEGENITHTPANNETYHHYREANIYGNATATIYGGYFSAAFAGSNTAGDIKRGTKRLFVYKTGPCACNPAEDPSCTNSQNEYILSLFGGSNEAVTHGNVELTVGCGVDHIQELYGGSNKAEIINGNVTLNVYGGHLAESMAALRA